jgi:aminopeptidase
MKISEFFDYAIDAMSYNYEELIKKLKPLKELMEKTDKVRITGPDTDITFSIKNMKVIPCVGEKNIPDGEIYTAPIKYSVNGTIKYNTPCPYQGNIFHNVKLTFEDGKITEATCDENDEKLNDIFNTDDGARYIGEFSLGLNKKIREPMGDILYDEKIIGSLHFTPGRAYKDAYNGNDSSIHWDMVLIQRKEYGGGNIYFDDKLIRQDGVFVLDELKDLN